MSTMMETEGSSLSEAMASLELALPAPGGQLNQDEEWVVARVGEAWRKIRLHDYNEVYAVPGLYERWVYDIFGCRSPQKIRELLDGALGRTNVERDAIETLDFGAGNGCVADELRAIGLSRFVGVDIVPEARLSAERDRPKLYDDYFICDITDDSQGATKALKKRRFDCMTCIAALGFGDIPAAAFLAAFNLVRDDGFVAFTIKQDFLDPADESGFSVLIRRMLDSGALEVDSKETYVHRTSTDGKDLVYVAFVGRKRANANTDGSQA